MSDTPSRSDDAEQPDQPEQPDDMREADVANGENPDAGGNRTGEDEARKNRENDPPA